MSLGGQMLSYIVSFVTLVGKSPVLQDTLLRGNSLTVWCDHHAAIVRIRRGQYGAILFGYHVCISLGLHGTILYIHQAIPVGKILNQHWAVICGHHASFVGMSYELHGAVLYGNHTTITKLSLGWRGPVLWGYYATLVWINLALHDPILCGYHSRLFGIILRQHHTALHDHHDKVVGMNLSQYGCPMGPSCHTCCTELRPAWHCHMWLP